MPALLFDIERAARRLIARYGSGARAEAAAWTESMWLLEDPDSAIVWTRISAAVNRQLEAELRPAPSVHAVAGPLRTAGA